MTAGGPKSPNKYFLQCSTFAFERVRTWRRQTCFLPRAPSNLVMPLLKTAIRDRRSDFGFGLFHA